MPYINSDGVQLYYESTGTGPVIVFVHEYAGDYRSWDEQVRFFSRHYRCIVFNARGYPPSDVPDQEEAYSQVHAVEDIRHVMTALDVDRAHIVGLSMGGYAALNFGLAYPDMARSMVIAAAGHGSDLSRRETFLADTQALVDRLLALGMTEGIVHYADSTVRKRLREKDPRGFERFNRHFAEHSPVGSALTALGYQMKRPSIYTLEDQLVKLELPALVVIGDDDTPCIEPGIFLKRTLPNGQLAIFPNTTHAVNLEEPELFNLTLQTFFRQVERDFQ